MEILKNKVVLEFVTVSYFWATTLALNIKLGARTQRVVFFLNISYTFFFVVFLTYLNNMASYYIMSSIAVNTSLMRYNTKIITVLAFWNLFNTLFIDEQLAIFRKFPDFAVNGACPVCLHFGSNSHTINISLLFFPVCRKPPLQSKNWLDCELVWICVWVGGICVSNTVNKSHVLFPVCCKAVLQTKNCLYCELWWICVSHIINISHLFFPVCRKTASVWTVNVNMCRVSGFGLRTRQDGLFRDLFASECSIKSHYSVNVNLWIVIP